MVMLAACVGIILLESENVSWLAINACNSNRVYEYILVGVWPHESRHEIRGKP